MILPDIFIIFLGILFLIILCIDMFIYKYLYDKIEWLELNKSDKKKKKEID